MRVPRTPNRMYKIELKTVELDFLLTIIEDQAWLWHGRLGHVNFRVLKQLASKEMARGVPWLTILTKSAVTVSQPSRLGCISQGNKVACRGEVVTGIC